MFVLWLVLFVIGGTGLACRLMAVSRRPAPPQPLRHGGISSTSGATNSATAQHELRR
jgi:hypothetical protein